MKIKITIKETNNVNFDELIPKLQHNIIKIGANELNGIIRKNTPKNEGHLHSTLRHSIHEKLIRCNSPGRSAFLIVQNMQYGLMKVREYMALEKQEYSHRKGKDFYLNQTKNMMGNMVLP